MSDTTEKGATTPSMPGDERRIASCPAEHRSLLERHDGCAVELEEGTALLRTATDDQPAQTEVGRFRFFVDFVSAQGQPSAPEVVQDLITAMAVLEPGQ